MITLSQVNQYAMDNNLGDDTDIFTILSKMQLEYKEDTPLRKVKDFSLTASHTEWTTEEVLELFST